MADHAEVQEGEAAIRGDKDIAGVWIGVKETVHQNLLEIGLEQAFGECRAFDVQPKQWSECRDLPAVNALHRQHTARAVAEHRLRHQKQGEAAQVLPNNDQVLRLAFVIEFLLDGRAKFLEHPDKAIALAEAGMRIEKRGDLGQHLEILRDLAADGRTLDFDDHRAPIAQGSGVDLSDRRRGQWLGIELRECLRDSHSKFAHDNLLDLRVGEWLHVILQPRQRLQVDVGQEVRPACEHLTDLDEGRPHRLEVIGKLLGAGRGGRRRSFAGAELEAGFKLGHQIRSAILPEQACDLLVSLEVGRREGGEFHDRNVSLTPEIRSAKIRFAAGVIARWHAAARRGRRGRPERGPPACAACGRLAQCH